MHVMRNKYFCTENNIIPVTPGTFGYEKRSIFVFIKQLVCRKQKSYMSNILYWVGLRPTRGGGGGVVGEDRKTQRNVIRKSQAT